MLDFRRGQPVVLRGDAGVWLAIPIECANPGLFQEMRAGANGPVRLVVTAHRLAYLGVASHASTAAIALIPGDNLQSAVHLAVDPNIRWPATRTVAMASPAEAAALALARRGLLVPSVICVEPDDVLARVAEERVANAEWLAVAITDVLAHCESAPLVRRASEAQVPLESGASRFVVFREVGMIREHVAVLIGDPATWPIPVPVRVHSSCLTGDLFGSVRCDCGSQLRRSVAMISERGGGVLLYLQQEGRGTGLANKMRAYQIQDDGLDTVDADQSLGFDEDERDYTVAREMLADLGVTNIDLLTNNPAKLAGVDQEPVRVASRSRLFGELTDHNRRYLQAKADRSGHWLNELLRCPDGRAD